MGEQVLMSGQARGGRRWLPPRRAGCPGSPLRGGFLPGREFLLDYDVIEAFCVAVSPGCASSTRGTYRSALYRLAAGVHGLPGQRPTPFAGAKAPALYSPGRARRAGRCRGCPARPGEPPSALAVVVFGIGAGLRPGELVALRGSDLIRRGRRVTVRVGGPAARVVPVSAAYAGRAAGLAAAAGHAHLFRPGPAGRGYKNFVTNFTRTLAADPAAPRLTLGRCRSSFICGQLAAGTPVGELLAITGICHAESLARYARHVDGAPAKAALRAWDKHRQG